LQLLLVVVLMLMVAVPVLLVPLLWMVGALVAMFM
jgi:hypothetical protein